jgi:hypothetical protein
MSCSQVANTLEFTYNLHIRILGLILLRLILSLPGVMDRFRHEQSYENYLVAHGISGHQSLSIIRRLLTYNLFVFEHYTMEMS